MKNSEHNPYTKPRAEEGLEEVRAQNTSFQGMSHEEIRKLYSRSCNLIVFTIIFGLATLVWCKMALERGFGLWDGGLALGCLSVFNLVATLGLFARTSWGRGMGIFGCSVAVFHFPVGTVFGICGLFELIGSSRLFGRLRLTHSDLKAEFKALRNAR